MLELLFLLLPVAAAYGWFFGRNSLRQEELKNKANVAKNLSSGLNFLLTDQEDKAIEQLLQLLDIEAATIDTYLALANLFRRKGDWDKAIRIHEKLHQLKLPKAQAQQIQLELAKDYFSAGLYDRAESLLRKLVDSDPLQETALKQLFAIFVVTHDWHKAADFAPQVDKTDSRSLRIALANMRCEDQKKPMDVMALRILAQKYPQAIRPRLQLARQLLAEQSLTDAAVAFKSVLTQKPQWAADILPELQRCQLPEEEWYPLLSQLVHKNKNITATIFLCDWLVQTGSPAAGEQLLLEKLQQQPNIRLFQRLLQVRQLNQPAQMEALQAIDGLVRAYLDTKILYSCRNCGFKTRQQYWLCPSCQQWETVEPLGGIDGR
ncbi:N-acetylglucosaminyl transferase [Rheinheimera texasensis]|uniref:N-acetylglucosaminyl transferase n=1 Tax=Rheinheimera texasensis TaxID=306205 RepID=UPI0032B24D79